MVESKGSAFNERVLRNIFFIVNMNCSFVLLAIGLVCGCFGVVNVNASTQVMSQHDIDNQETVLSSRKKKAKKNTQKVDRVLVSVGRVYTSKTGSEKKYVSADHHAKVIKVIKNKLKVSAEDHPDFICYVRIEDTDYQEQLEAAQ